MVNKANRDEIYFDGEYISAFLDGRGFAFDDDGNEYQRRNKKWVRTRRPYICYQLSKSMGKLKNPKVRGILAHNMKLRS